MNCISNQSFVRDRKRERGRGYTMQIKAKHLYIENIPRLNTASINVVN